MCVKREILEEEAKCKGRPEWMPVKSWELSLSAKAKSLKTCKQKNDMASLFPTVSSLQGFSDLVSPCHPAFSADALYQVNLLG